MPLIKKVDSDTGSEEPRNDSRTQSRECLDLTVSLNSADASARRWAARDLAGCEGASAHLVERLHIEAEPSVREVILTSLTRLRDPIAIAGLVECLRSEDVMLRNEAVEAMKGLPDEMGPIMTGLLADTDPDVRIFTVNILESLRHPDVESWLIQVIDHDAHINVCATAVDLLTEVGTSAAVPALQRLSARFPNEPYIQFACDLALKRIGKG
jgi:HEAT repeat protein